ncbi:pilus assembly protein PilP [Candidatus Magnetobacterium casense]|uniref:Pilus assembly protein PilP n=1 Tax=Candidatus Magnetobacterium casense TaxID=1455061 RepID=A0ABS6RVB2_9BACT|nr:pilus assembly protein PilP [Candidatus Magnetobacterium casensis]MBV6340566.1 pilus assembly protein PilP [Candidatus Magnetobacterium casensis]
MVFGGRTMDAMLKKWCFVSVMLMTLMFSGLAVRYAAGAGTDQPAAAGATPGKTQPAPVNKTVDKPVEPIVPYEYNPQGRRDPFMSILELNKKKRQKEKGPRDTRILSPLETVNWANMKLIGIVIDRIDKYASVVLSDGRAFAIKKGTFIGMNGGKVVEIRHDRIVVEEIIVDDVGRSTVKRLSMCLNQEEASGCDF